MSDYSRTQMRKQSRVDAQFLEEQKVRREAVSTTPGDSQNSIPALRDRVTLLEEILSTREVTE